MVPAWHLTGSGAGPVISILSIRRLHLRTACRWVVPTEYWQSQSQWRTAHLSGQDACARTKLGGDDGQAALEPTVGPVELLSILHTLLIASLALDSVPAGLDLQHSMPEPKSLNQDTGSKHWQDWMSD